MVDYFDITFVPIGQTGMPVACCNLVMAQNFDHGYLYVEGEEFIVFYISSLAAP